MGGNSINNLYCQKDSIVPPQLSFFLLVFSKANNINKLKRCNPHKHKAKERRLSHFFEIFWPTFFTFQLQNFSFKKKFTFSRSDKYLIVYLIIFWWCHPHASRRIVSGVDLEIKIRTGLWNLKPDWNFILRVIFSSPIKIGIR